MRPARPFFRYRRDLRPRARDERRTAILATQGIRVIRFTNLEVLNSFEAVCARIEEELAGIPKT
jgi:very-short-patch-repair endonuclease